MSILQSRAVWLPVLAMLIAFPAIGQSGTPASSNPTTTATAGAIALVAGTPQRRAAEEGLAVLTTRLSLPQHAAQATRIFAVDDSRLLRDAVIGYGFEVELVDPNALLAGNSIDASTRESGQWRFVVMLANRPIGLVTVASTHGQWKMVEAGGNELAQEVMTVVGRYRSTSPPARLRFVRSQQGVADFIEVTPSSPTDRTLSTVTPQYVPLLSARMMLGNSPADTATSHTLSASPVALSETDVAPALRESVRRGMHDLRFTH
ncbi:hypothetical protein [Trinickia fusca]|uniref:Uncharacterized protein n=1 Tax=Trinickia fusca TaxID=2419777 RepID=A0A494XRL7_9BURK|nr:hypothetical protein [Trinickia fusca]RKP50749.1 hypothetical protein D7S89_06625 [Trinickia fusca]